MTEIIVALITGGLALVGVMITNSRSNSKIEQRLEINQAVTDTKLENLTAEVKKHNDFASRLPVVEEQIKVINHRIEDLEAYHKGN